MCETGFAFTAGKSNYEYTREREDIMTMGENYQLKIGKYREEGFEIYYQDETWAHKNMGCAKVWQFTESGDVFYKVPSGKGERCIISHTGSKEHGLFDGAALVFRGSKANKHADYHTDVFVDWMEKKVSPRLSETA